MYLRTLNYQVTTQFQIHLCTSEIQGRGGGFQHRRFEEFVEVFQWVLSPLSLVFLFQSCVTKSILRNQCEPLWILFVRIDYIFLILVLIHSIHLMSSFLFFLLMHSFMLGMSLGLFDKSMVEMRVGFTILNQLSIGWIYLHSFWT